MRARLLAVGLAMLLTACGSGSASQTQIVAATPPASRAATPSPVATVVQQILVYVTGAVARPGVYGLSPDSRVEDAVAAAGGFLPGADMPRVNLAARVHDEEEIFVPKVGEALPSLMSKAININTASAAQLRDALSIPSTLASRIVAYRRQHGPYRTVDDLRLVPVPDEQLSRIRTLVSAG